MSASVSSRIERRGAGPVARLTIEREAKLNSLDSATLEGIAHELRELPGEVRAVVLTGAGARAFAGGASLDELAGLDPVSAREFITRVHQACDALRECPVPVIARVNGYCLGAGLELAAACDLRIAADGARFGMPEVRLGIPSVVEAALLPRLIGAGRARWLVLTGETIDAARALEWGLVERVVPAAGLDGALDAALEALLAADDAALRAQKRLCKLWEEAPLGHCVHESIDEFARAYAGEAPRRMIGELLAAKNKRR